MCIKIEIPHIKKYTTIGKILKSGYLRMEEIYTSYAVSLKPRKIPTRVWLKFKNLRVVNHTNAYLLLMFIV